ncbi:hypothetical protein [Arthrobacter dokdonensis]|uniref:hypothetical protein n=1 Tax=Arthrobacter dokdonellae TaxID=2211210 RepID=UPI001013C61B|nr:hypothetical protein [Arthrobacter dokdonellae]
MARWKLSISDLVIGSITGVFISLSIWIIVSELLNFPTSTIQLWKIFIPVMPLTIWIAFYATVTKQQYEKDANDLKQRGEIDPYIKESKQKIIRLLISSSAVGSVVILSIFPLSPRISPDAQISGKPTVTESHGNAIFTAKSIAELLDPKPVETSVLLAGRPVQTKTYTISAKNCSDSSIEAQAELGQAYSTILISFSLGDSAPVSVRMNIVLTIDGISEDSRILSPAQGVSMKLNVRGKRALKLKIATLGQSSLTCVESAYAVAVSGTALP